MQNGISKRSGSEGSETVVLRLANIGDSDFNVSDLRTIRLTEKEIENYTLKTNDVVMIRVNGSKTNVGRQILVSSDSGWSFCDHIIRIRFNEKCLAKYMVYFSQTKRYRDYVLENMVSSAGQNTISRKGLSKLTLNLPTLPEQQEIVRILDIVLEKESRAKEAAGAVLEQIAMLKKTYWRGRSEGAVNGASIALSKSTNQNVPRGSRRKNERCFAKTSWSFF